MSDGLIRRLAAVACTVDKPVIVVVQFGPFTNGLISRLYDYGVVGYPSIARGMRAIRWLVERGLICERLLRSRQTVSSTAPRLAPLGVAPGQAGHGKGVIASFPRERNSRPSSLRWTISAFSSNCQAAGR